MSDADKIKACYNYLIDHTDYARGHQCQVDLAILV